MNIIKFFVLSLTVTAIFLGSQSFAKAGDNCSAMGLYCQSPGGYVEGYWYVTSQGTHPDGTYYRICVKYDWRRYFTCSGTDSNCTCSGSVCGAYAYSTQAACEADVGAPLSGAGGVGCCGRTPPEPSCTPSCGSCSSGTYYSSQPSNYYPSGTRTCKRSNCSKYTQTCYSQCPSGDTCASEGYVNSCPSDETCVPRTVSWSVPHSDCTSSKSCEFVCPRATCENYSDVSGIDWYDTCPTANCRTANLNVPIEGEPNDCPHYETKTCHTTNQKPNPTPPDDETTTNVEIVPESEITGVQAYSTNLLTKLVSKIKAQETGWDIIWGYSTNQHSGIYSTNPQQPSGLNNPVGLKASYTDTDGQEDIMALYVWFSDVSRTSKDSLTIPDMIDIDSSEEPLTDTNDNWGFLLTRNSYGGEWEKVYVPARKEAYVRPDPYCVPENTGEVIRYICVCEHPDSYRTESYYVPDCSACTTCNPLPVIKEWSWTHVGNIGENVYIEGPMSKRMVKLSNINVTSEDANNRVLLELLMTFISEFSPEQELVSSGKYNIWSQVNDYIGFTALLEDGNIKELNKWEDSGKDWTMDLERPLIENVETSEGTDRCIFLVSGNVTIDKGDDPAVNSKVDYDVIEGYIIAGGEIVIEYDSALNGLIVEGGLAAFNLADSRKSIRSLRTIDWMYRNKHPVIAVKGDAKYGILSRTLFGSQVDVFRVDIGFKPY